MEFVGNRVANLKCPKCSTIVPVSAGETPVCPRCGFGRPSPRRQVPATVEPPTPPEPEEYEEEILEEEVEEEEEPEPVRAQEPIVEPPPHDPPPSPRTAPAYQQPSPMAPAPVAHPPQPNPYPGAIPTGYPQAQPQTQVYFYPNQQAPHPQQNRNAPSTGAAVVGLLLNIFIWPGLGSLIGGRQVGWSQGFLFLLGVLLTLILIGFFILIIVWIWGIVTGVQMINDASAANRGY